MLKAHIDRRQTNSTLETFGSGAEIINDICLVIHSIYKDMEAHNPISAVAFRKLLQLLINDPKFWAMDPAICPKWGSYQEALRAYNAQEQKERRSLDDYQAVRSMPDVIRRKKRGESD